VDGNAPLGNAPLNIASDALVDSTPRGVWTALASIQFAFTAQQLQLRAATSSPNAAKTSTTVCSPGRQRQSSSWRSYRWASLSPDAHASPASL